MVTTFYSTNDHDSTEHIPAEFATIVKRCQSLVKQITDNNMKQVIVIQTTDNKIYKNIIDYSSDAEIEEQKFLNAIKKNDTVLRLICCWCDGSFDMPSYYFRKQLCELNKSNETAQMILSGEKIYILKSIRDTFPKL